MSRSTTLLTIMLAALPAFVFAESSISHPQHQATKAQASQVATVTSFPDTKHAAVSDTPEEKPWSVTVGLGVGYGSLYEGSARRKFFPLPIFEATYYDWSLGFEGLQYRFVNNEKFVIGAGVGYDFGRKEDELPNNRRGLGDVKGGAEVSIFAEYYPIQALQLNLAAIKSYGDSDSLLITAGAASEFPLYGKNLSGNIGIGVTWANDDHMRSYYSVNAQQSTRSGLRRFNAESGIKSVNLSAGVTYLLSKRWALNLNGGVDILQGDAADSPIVDGDTQFSVFSTITYTF